MKGDLPRKPIPINPFVVSESLEPQKGCGAEAEKYSGQVSAHAWYKSRTRSSTVGKWMYLGRWPGKLVRR